MAYNHQPKKLGFKIALLAPARSWYTLQLLEILIKEGFTDLLLLARPEAVTSQIQTAFRYRGMGPRWIFNKMLERWQARWRLNKPAMLTDGQRPQEIVTKNFNDLITVETLSRKKIDIGIAYNTGMLKPQVFTAPKHGILCAHPSLLPKGRGFEGAGQAILAGDPTGVTTFIIDEGIDTGDILLQEAIETSSLHSFADLYRRLAEVSLRLTVESIKGLAAGTLTQRPQAQRYPIRKLTAEERRRVEGLWERLFAENRARLGRTG